MPELPEVETIRRGLTNLVQGTTIVSVDALYPKMLNMPAKEFENMLAGKEILQIDRRGKYLLIRLSDDYTLVSHLRMEGKYDVVPEGTENQKHTYVVFHLNDERELRYNDTRKFGKMNLVKDSQVYDLSGLNKIGPEPTEEDLTFDYLKKQLHKSHRKIKAFLLDQSNIAGIGNIYADETLWLSKIHPEQATNYLSDQEIETLRENIIKEIQLAIKGHGTTVFTYKNAFGEEGSFQNHLHVYGKKGQPCERCGTPIEKIKVAQRGTSFCPYCQRVHGDLSE
ncbi:DNA-formamidopyrimidine glycosylase [Fructilactobacillus fructivorans]|uniref:Formamidopyrimidine-DNA glycosylase n=1 Tax=Fructilactobacillus fructivorans TaxID=1614 RepID=A0A0C1LYY3_9LACO|nr:DNA-formamidopyrimidine glycosylase [Fructilactobacillus fructivorans]KID42100.1 Formamidopyrimidine-DNA glycosylase [Fructilactobacillus fructivorans]MCT0151992.1 DNA-formamidopyrimidine glycosylase [Fructilactobacillus fructivorans]MCT2867884.1 DNA-formamidopyrimidine glycosylase [Fructilactobacillus fructivorans]MCT2868534.1 DNA-formamidopyrimidine glycosylase [Fructilactobacillus fructivorans]MCT2873534.1 DNA-formamidopyrimidine glycosylase [Fructilactobacillus fructivorans]